MTAIDSLAKSHGDAHEGEHGHGHGQYPFLAHHFETPAQQFDAGKLGMWVFLATEILFFGALFAMYAVMRYREPEVFSYASHYLDTIMGGVNTCVLILSSLTMAMAVHFAQRSKRGPLLICLFLTFLGACGFLVIKYFEYAHKIHENLVWGPTFYEPVGLAGEEQSTALVDPTLVAPPAPPAPPGMIFPTAGFVKVPSVDASIIKPAPAGPAGVASAQGAPGTESQEVEGKTHLSHVLDPNMPVNTHRFFAIYYAMTGLHGIHVVIGMFLIAWLMFGAAQGKYTSQYFTPVDFGGLYWHIVDLIWIFLFPLFYLIH